MFRMGRILIVAERKPRCCEGCRFCALMTETGERRCYVTGRMIRKPEKMPPANCPVVEAKGRRRA